MAASAHELLLHDLLAEAERAERRLRRSAATGALSLVALVLLASQVEDPSRLGWLITGVGLVYALSMAAELNVTSLRRKAIETLERGELPEELERLVAEETPVCPRCHARMFFGDVLCPSCQAVLRLRPVLLAGAFVLLMVMGLLGYLS